MMRLAVALALSILCSPAFAQVAAPPPQQEKLQPSPEQRARFRAARDACVADVKPRSLPRGERRKAMRSCMEAKNPDMKPIFARGEARRAEMRQVRDSCRDEMRARRLGRDERRQAMQTCMVQKKPELAKMFSCRDEAVRKNLNPGPERRDFMRTCLRA
jgi:hypothetical protein